MKAITSILTFLILNLSSYACDAAESFKLVSANRNLVTFSGIDLRNTAHVFISQGDEQSVLVEAQAEVLSEIRTEVLNDKLIIDNREKKYTHGPVNIYIVVKDLCLLELSGSGTIVTQGLINCDNMTIRISGTGIVKTNLTALNLKAAISGEGNLELRGSADHADIRISGSGNVEAKTLSVFSVNVSIHGNGTALIDARNELSVNIDGNGHVFYLHEPWKIRSIITGAGDILKS